MLKRKTLITDFPERYTKTTIRTKLVPVNSSSEIQVGDRIKLLDGKREGPRETPRRPCVCEGCREKGYYGRVTRTENMLPDVVMVLLENRPECRSWCTFEEMASHGEQGCFADIFDFLKVEEIVEEEELSFEEGY